MNEANPSIIKLTERATSSSHQDACPNDGQAEQILSHTALTPTQTELPSLGRHLSYPNFTARDAEAKPRKYIGYRVFSRWMASDDAFFILRRFGTLNARVLLAMQDEITELEDRLSAIDDALCWAGPPEEIDNGTFRNDPSHDRRELVQKILPEKLARYTADVLNTKRWLAPHLPEALHDLESSPLPYESAIDGLKPEYVNYTDDLLRLESNNRSWIRRASENVLLRIPMVRGFFERLPQDYTTMNANTVTVWQDDQKVGWFLSWVGQVLTAGVGLGRLLGPLWILEVYKESDSSLKLGIITAFISLFFALVAIATKAKVVDALAAAAAYAAVLIVFLQIGSLA